MGLALPPGLSDRAGALRGSAPDQAWELFRPEGPFAVLPLGGDAFQLVWSAPLQRLRQLEQLDAVAFLDALSAALPEELQAEVLLDQPRAFPVALEWAWPLARRGTVVVGEVAHRCHPVGGQGLNLCWRDVDQLHRLARRCGDGRLRPRSLPGAYGRARVLDIALVLLATDALVRLFSNRFAHPAGAPLGPAGPGALGLDAAAQSAGDERRTLPPLAELSRMAEW